MLPSDSELAPLLGKRVRIRLDEDTQVEGVLLRWSDHGEVVYRGADGDVWHAWPLLGMEEISAPAS